MKILDVVQGTDEWKDARLGRPTSSCFHKILTPKTLKLAAGRRKYLHELVAEKLLRVPLDEAYSAYMERGSEMEDQARSYYEMQKGVDVLEVGFVTTDDGKVGASPDGLIEVEAGGLEIKIPAPTTHTGYLLDGIDAAYRCQIQGSMYVCEREWWDFLSYNPVIDSPIIRVYRDEGVITALKEALSQFCDEVDEAMEKVK